MSPAASMRLRRADPRAAAARLRPHVVFTVGAVAFALDARHARHVLRAGAGTAGPRVEFLGAPYPLVDLRRLFGHPGAADAGFVLLVESGGRAGLHVDDLRGVAAIDAEHLTPLPAVYRGAERRWIAGLATTGDDLIVVAWTAELLRTLLEGGGR
jgi:chemotaxis signal transduction protein